MTRDSVMMTALAALAVGAFVVGTWCFVSLIRFIHATHIVLELVSSIPSGATP